MNESAEERRIIAKGKNYQEAITHTDNTRLAAIFLVFGAVPHSKCPSEWVDIHGSVESFIKNKQNPTDPKYLPKPKVTFNFYSGGIPEAQIIKAFETDYDVLNDAFEDLIADLAEEKKEKIRQASSQLLVRICREVLLRREELVRHIKRTPDSAKLDQVSNGKKTIWIGKNSSPELRSKYLSKLTG